MVRKRPTPCYLQSSSVYMPSFKPVAPFFFMAKVPFCFVYLYRKGCGHVDMLMRFPWVTLILNIYQLVGLNSTVQPGWAIPTL